MATSSGTATASGWTKVAAATDDFLLENQGPHSLLVTLQAAAPAAGAPGHLLKLGQSMVRVGQGDVYVKAAHGSQGCDYVITI